MADDDPSSFSSPEAAIAHYRDLVDSLQSQLTEANEDIKDYTESSKELQEELEKELARMEKGEKEMRRGLEEARSDVESWKTKYTTALREHTTTMTHMQRELESLRTSEKELRDKLRDMELDNDDLEKSEREKDSSLQDLENRYGKSIERIALLEEELVNKAQLDEEVQRLKDELRELHEEMGVIRAQAATTYPPAYPRPSTPTRATPAPVSVPADDSDHPSGIDDGYEEEEAFATPTKANPMPTASAFSPNPEISLVNPTPARTPHHHHHHNNHHHHHRPIATTTSPAPSPPTDQFGTPTLPSPPPPVPSIPEAFRPSSISSASALTRSSSVKNDLSQSVAASTPSRIGTPKTIRNQRAEATIQDMRDMTSKIRQLTSRLDSRKNRPNLGASQSGIPRPSVGSPGGSNLLGKSTNGRRTNGLGNSTLGRSIAASGSSSLAGSRTSSRASRVSTEEDRSALNQLSRPSSRSGLRMSMGRTGIPVRPPSRLASLSASTADRRNDDNYSNRSETSSSLLRNARSPTPTTGEGSVGGTKARPPWGAPQLATSTRRRTASSVFDPSRSTSGSRPSSVASHGSSSTNGGHALGLGRPSSSIDHQRRPSSKNDMLGTSITPSGAAGGSGVRRPTSSLGLNKSLLRRPSGV